MGPTPVSEARAVHALAEDLNAAIPLGPGDERIDLGYAVLWIGAGGTHPLLNVVLRLRMEADVAARVASIREIFRARGRPEASWEIGPSATPGDLRERLFALGMVPYEDDSIVTAMVLTATRELRVETSNVVTRPVTGIDDAVRASEVLNAVFGERQETAQERRERVAATWDGYTASGRAAFLATVDGEPVAAAHAIYMPEAVVLCGGGTLPRARGLGAYRALVAARYQEAVRRGTPTLVVQAAPASRPILARLGFEAVATIEVLHDRF